MLNSLLNTPTMKLSIILFTLSIYLTGAFAGTVPNVDKYEWHITAGTKAPDCWERQVLLVNGEFQPSLTVTQGDILEIIVYNDLPLDYQDVSAGISIHWHGFEMIGAQWYDGVSYTTQCPILPTKSFTYKFQVNEMPGTYFWHAHSGAQRADGLAGALIVRPRVTPNAMPKVDGEMTVLLMDWWHASSGQLTRRLNRPFDPAKQTPSSGKFVWVGNPQAVLINGGGFYPDCNVNPTGVTTPVTCNVKYEGVPPGNSVPEIAYASQLNPGCNHTTFTVIPGKTYLLRVINAGSLAYQTLSIEGHSLTVIAADAVPVVPFTVTSLDINSGQRYDVLLKADQPPTTYWVSSFVQFRAGSPAGYAMLKYGAGAPSLPSTPTPQPGSVAPWTPEFTAASILLDTKLIKQLVAKDNTYKLASMPVPKSTVEVGLNASQPLLKQTGQIRWALDNVAYLNTPPCDALQATLQSNPNWLTQNKVAEPTYNDPNYSPSGLGQQIGPSSPVSVFVKDPKSPVPLPIYPVAGTHVVTLNKGDVVDIVVQNNAANAFNGDYRPDGSGRTAREQHPFHHHMHRFWVLYTGTGTYPGAAAVEPLLNTVNPPYRDTATLWGNNYIVLRFVADNPGVSQFHCHIFYHQYMGQMISFAYNVNELPPPPADMPSCPEACIYNAAPWPVAG